MIVFDNIIFSLQKAGGISVVWSELVKRMLNTDIHTKYIEYSCLDNICREKLSIPIEWIFLKSCSFLWVKRYFKVKMGEKEKFIFHSSYYRTASDKSAINVTTVHDFTYEYYYTGLRKKIHCWQKYKAIRESDYIICISENTKKDLLKFIPDAYSQNIRVIYNGVSNDYYPIVDLHTIKLPFEHRTYVVHVGSRATYKNFNLSVNAIANTTLSLVIVGGGQLSKSETDYLNEVLGFSRYTYLGHISNDRLNDIYNGAEALFYLSEYEGFGIPVIEAQKAGCPVIAYASSSIPEIMGDTPLLIDELSVSNVLKCLEKLKSNSLRIDVVKRGLENAKRFTWDLMCEQVLALYQEIIERNKL